MELEQTKDSFLGNIGKNVSFTSQEQEEDLLETLYVWWKEGKTVETTRLCLTMNTSQQELHALVDRMVVHGYLQKREDWEVMELTSYGNVGKAPQRELFLYDQYCFNNMFGV